MRKLSLLCVFNLVGFLGDMYRERNESAAEGAGNPQLGVPGEAST